MEQVEVNKTLLSPVRISYCQHEALCKYAKMRVRHYFRVKVH